MDIWDKLTRLWKKAPEKAKQYVLEGKAISPYIHNPEERALINQLLDHIEASINGSEGHLLEVDPMTDLRVGRIDLFPNNFKYNYQYVDSVFISLWWSCLSTLS